MKRFAASLIVLSALLASCGGTTPTTPTPPNTTIPEPTTPMPPPTPEPTPPTPTPTTVFIPAVGATVGSGDGTVTGTVRISPNAEEIELLTLINELRTKGTVNGQNFTANTCVDGTFKKDTLQPLTFHGLLSYAARKHSTYLSEVDYDGHMELQTESPFYYGGTVQERFDRAYIDHNLIPPKLKPGEIVGTGMSRSNAVAILRDWMASPGHCAVLMYEQAKHMGAGHYYVQPNTAANRWGHSWTMMFY
ncbi:CAP domain-containing protein [Deinococcus sp. 12RED42]|uniref:CAP domain-containing protein n=1 Tax=Deinococcus sp. 12RED42 TaxID=2745872 RepID=UPI001E61265E|nr:CAP domain-containing protein [Deinococcus sp. 12RED42]MCD0164149.1 CAP domain-containing protein [Deinococcus sp. 12RED42]